ncbi:MAG TPA: hypothetical protein DIT65_03940 [Cryomorphaceae bacterium]|nr:hypothetical protein [Cryomorphaceae bacterium]|tara:strand:- start:603 stop:1244 length:642 start_codon:yes stop_codon:yes gene_type:complete
MNFLAHLHCSPNHESIRFFNFTGDGFRGNAWKNGAEPAVVLGVELHRFIDHFTDQHEASIEVKSHLRLAAGKTAPIALDLLGDYFLHKHWGKVALLQPHTALLNAVEFIDSCTLEIESGKKLLVGKAADMWPWMKSEKWLMDYQNLKGIRRAAQGICGRHPAIAPLGYFFTDFEAGCADYQYTEQWFLSFYPELISACQKFIKEHPLGKAAGV